MDRTTIFFPIRSYSSIPYHGNIAPTLDRKSFKSNALPLFWFILGILAFGLIVLEPVYKSNRILHKEAPNFLFWNSQKELQNLTNYRGKVILLNFWAEWCAPCLKEMPQLKALEEHFAGRPFQLLAVHVDPPFEAIIPFLSEPNFPRSLFSLKDPSEVAKYEVTSIPKSYLIDGKGVLTRTYQGEYPWMSELFLKQVEALFASLTAP